MTQGLTGFVNTGSAALQSTYRHVDYENVTQGGNFILATGPLAMQAMYAGSVLSAVTTVASGAFYWVAQFFSCLFHPLISLPLSFFSTAVRGYFYESSVKITSAPATKYYAQEEAEEEVKGTVTLSVGGRDRHYLLGKNVNWYVDGTILVDEKRYYYHRLADGEAFDDQCREVEINGEQVRVKLEQEAEKKFVTFEIDGVKHHYELLREVEEPIEHTIKISIPFDQINWQEQPVRWERFIRLVEIPGNDPEDLDGCPKMTAPEMSLIYKTGREIDAPREGSYTFVIDGAEHHFATATYGQSVSEGISGWINQASNHLLGCSLLPTRISRFSRELLTYINENASDFIRVMLVVAGVALLYFGQIGMAAGALIAVAYEYLDHDLGVIPHDISLFMEQWMPTLSLMGLLLTGSWFWQFIAGASLLLTVPEIQRFVHQQLAKGIRQVGIPLIDRIVMSFEANERPPQLDDLMRRIEALPELEEVDAPLERREMMNLAEIEEILNAPEDQFELNPAALSKNMEPLLVLPEDRNFPVLLELWDRFDWTSEENYQVLLRRLADDERFIVEFLQEHFPEVHPFHFEHDPHNQLLSRAEQTRIANDLYRLQIQAYIEQLCAETGETKQQFAARWSREQLEYFVNKLNGTQAIAGERTLLVEAMDAVAQTIPFLTNENANPIDLIDSLSKLAIQGGNYCTLGMRRASREVLDNFKGPLLAERAAHLSPAEKFEYDVKELFQIARLQAMQGFFQMVTNWLRDSEHTRTTADDVHLYEAVTRALKRAFYPMSNEEMEDFCLTELMMTETILLPMRAELWNEFVTRIPEAMRLLSADPLNIYGANRCRDYLQNWIENHPGLSQEDKDHLLNYAEDDAENQIHGALHMNAYLGDQLAGDRWNRLFLTVIGIYRKRPAAA